MPRLGGEQRVQRVEPERRSAECPRPASTAGQIGEIADPPVRALRSP